jgi:hypothetical protein
MGKQYIRFDEIEDVLTSVDLLALVTPLVKSSPSQWKWIIIGAQNGLQGAMVSVLGGTSSVDVLDKKSRRLVLAWHENREGPYPKERLAEFDVLLKRCHEAGLLKLKEAEEKDLLRLHNEFRNTFSHFMPMSWSIEKAGLPRIVCTALDCIEKLMSSDKVRYKMSGNRTRRLFRGIEAARGSFR